MKILIFGEEKQHVSCKLLEANIFTYFVLKWSLYALLTCLKYEISKDLNES